MARTPVLVGVGVAHGRGEEAADLMVAAVRAAADDAGAPALLRRVDRVAVPQGTWSYGDAGRLVAERIGAPGARTVVAAVGVPQQTLVSRTLTAVARGEIDVAVVVGADTKARAAAAARAGVDAPETVQDGAVPDEHLVPAGELMAAVEVDAGLWDPVAQYAVIENALGHAEGRTPEQLQHDVAELWSRFSAVAADNPHAAFGTRRDRRFLAEPSAENRLLAFPYNKWHSAQWRVDQGGALLICSTDAAEAAGVASERWIHPRVALESSHSLSLSRRRHLHRWPAMAVLGRAAEAHLGRPLAGIEHVELYSCFPAAVRVQQRELGIDPSATPTVTGGMAFAGGPFNNFTYQATAAVIARVRTEPGTLGLVTTVSGLLTKPGLMVWSTDPGPGALVADLAAEAQRETEEVPVTRDYRGEAAVAGYTVLPAAEGPTRVAVIADTPAGQRVVAVCDDAEYAADVMRRSPIGSVVAVDGTAFRPTTVGNRR